MRYVILIFIIFWFATKDDREQDRIILEEHSKISKEIKNTASYYNTVLNVLGKQKDYLKYNGEVSLYSINNINDFENDLIERGQIKEKFNVDKIDLTLTNNNENIVFHFRLTSDFELFERLCRNFKINETFFYNYSCDYSNHTINYTSTIKEK